MKNETSYFEGRDAQKLFFQCWLPDSLEIKAYILAMHGLAAHSDRLKLIAEYLTEKGYALYSFDLRGHYRNIIDVKGHIESMETIQKDIVLFMNVLKPMASDKKIFMMGQSFGGLTALIYAIKHPKVGGIIAASPLFDLSMNKNIGKKGIKNLLKIGSAMKLTPYEIDQKEMTGDLKVLRQYLSDKKVLKELTIKTISEVNSALKWATDNIQNLLCPALILQAGDDKFADKNLIRKLFEKIKSGDKTYKEYDSVLHELFSERTRNQVYQDIFVWLENHK